LTARRSKKIEKALKKNGFIKLTTHHNRYFYRTLSGVKAPIKTFISHGSKDYGDQLLSDIAVQLNLTKKELLSLIDGEMTREEYEAILRVKGVI
jgi:predicted RNA binding protein YcfA (HicA-like mRNA interferase family)